jgi:capsular exopolysaccharide synthesis family protein
MSRIEEALKRASRGASANVAQVEFGDAKPVPTDTSLSYYPLEDRPSAREDRPPAREERPSTRSDQREPAPPAVVLAPRTARTGHPGRFDSIGDEKLVVTDRCNAVSLEEYRRLAATLHAVQSERGLRTLMVTSAAPRDGKTLTVTNLALTLSESYGRRVLLIDGDLRHPSVHTLLRMPNTTGLNDVLRSEHLPLPLVEVSPTLTFLPAGRSDGSRFIGVASDRMRAVIQEAAARFDWVLVDTPPIVLLSDAKLMAELADAVVFVISAGVTPYSLVQRAIAELGPERILGTVLNRVDGHAAPVAEHYLDYYRSSEADRG